MKNIESLIPFCKIWQTNSDKIRRPIGDTQASLIDSSFGRTKIMGLDDVTIKYGMGYITVDISFPIHQHMLQNVEIDDKTSELYKLFALDSTWDIEFGWGGGEAEFKIYGMKMINWGINYESDKRAFIAKFTLVPAPKLILSDIKFDMISHIFDDIIDATEMDIEGAGHPRSLGGIISKVLETCRSLISTDETYTAYRQWLNSDPNSQPVELNSNPKILSPMRKYAHIDTWSTGGDIKRNTRRLTLSKRFFSATRDDIPYPSTMRLLTFGNKTTTAKEKSKYFNSNPIPNSDPIFAYAKNPDSSANLSVYAFIEELLRSWGYTLFPNFEALNKDGKIKWMIIQTEFNNIGKVEEKEWIGINTVEKEEATVNGGKLVNTIINPTEKNDDRIFDLHSNRNVVLSINATTDEGVSTIGSSYITDALVRGGKNSTEIKNNEDETNVEIEKERESIFALLAEQAKIVEMECLGLPELKIADNIIVNLGGVLYSGKYKVIEIEHKISESFTTSIRAVQTIEGTGEDVESPDDQDKKMGFIGPLEDKDSETWWDSQGGEHNPNVRRPIDQALNPEGTYGKEVDN